MCGISGILRLHDNSPIEYEKIKAMTDVIRHRGPDDEGFHLEGGIALGHRRLSIIDLSTGKQPIYNEDKSVCVILNGEIYNFKILRKELIEKGHVFTTKTDTEVIVHLYEEFGARCVEQLRGMFAFAVWDSRRRLLLIARDRLGIKPLYYSVTKNELLFASEIKSILEYRPDLRQVDLQGLSDFLTFMYTPGETTLFKKIKKLLPGHTLICIDGKLEERSYWEHSFLHQDGKPEEFYKEQLLELITESVKMRLISDVPLGAFLSGGIDSSLIVAIMSSLASEPVKTFSVGFDYERFSELRYAKLVADRYGTDHHEIVVGFNDFVSNLSRLIWYRDEPLSYPADVPTFLVAELARQHVKVVLSGEGGDELFAGYPKYAFDPLSKYFQLVPERIRDSFLKAAVNTLPFKFRKAKLAARCLNIQDEAERWTSWFSAFDGDDKEQLFSDPLKGAIRVQSKSIFEEFLDNLETVEPLDRMLYLDTKVWLPDNLLMKGDKMTMASSLEGRVPLLDHKLVEFAGSVPARYKVNGLKTKYILKEISRDLVPEKIINRKKVGFTVPVGLWFKKELKEFVAEILLSRKMLDRGYFNQHTINRIVEHHQAGKRDYQREIWTLLNLEIWHRIFIDGEDASRYRL